MLPKTAKDTKDSQSRLDFFLMEVRASANVKKRMMMEAANGSTSELPGCVEMLEIDVEGLKTWAHAFIVPSAPYWLLLGHPWQ